MFRQFRSRPLQTALTILAVALGVAVVTAVAAFLDINRQSQKTFINSVQARSITLQTREDDSANSSDWNSSLVTEVGLVDDQPITLTEEDLEQARAAAPSVAYAFITSPVGLDTSSIAESGADILAVSKDYLAANDITLSEGSSFSESDFVEQRNVVLASRRLLELIDKVENPIGQTVTAWDQGSVAFEIIGVMADKPDTTLPDLLIPFRPDPYNPTNPPTFVVNDVANLNQARAELEAFATKTWGGRVMVRSVNLEKYTTQQRTTRFLIAMLASVSLVSAALNIMNLMLAQVFKNRRETGILRSLGATRAIIRNQYLSNALVLGSVGGVLGVALGYLLLLAFNNYIATANPDALGLFPSRLTLVIGFASALGISAVFALYPALLASRLNVVEALKGS
jgi:putative ABC transport system permease protein